MSIVDIRRLPNPSHIYEAAQVVDPSPTNLAVVQMLSTLQRVLEAVQSSARPNSGAVPATTELTKCCDPPPSSRPDAGPQGQGHSRASDDLSREARATERNANARADEAEHTYTMADRKEATADKYHDAAHELRKLGLTKEANEVEQKADKLDAEAKALNEAGDRIVNSFDKVSDRLNHQAEKKHAETDRLYAQADKLREAGMTKEADELERKADMREARADQLEKRADHLDDVAAEPRGHRHSPDDPKRVPYDQGSSGTQTDAGAG